MYSGTDYVTNQLADYTFSIPNVTLNTESPVEIIIEADNGELTAECGIFEYSSLQVFGCCTGDVPEVCMERTVIPYDRCGSEGMINRFAIDFVDYSWNFPWTNVSFTEYSDGTARVVGTAKNIDDPSIEFYVDATYSGKTFTAPEGSPKAHSCQNPDPSQYYYYTQLEGTVSGRNAVSGAVIKIERYGESFQIGPGANVIANSLDFSASGWFEHTVIRQPTNTDINLVVEGRGDFNFVFAEDDMPSCLGGGNNTGGGNTATCGEFTITYGAGVIDMVGAAGQSYYFKINDLDNGWAQAFGCGWNCGHQQTATDLPNGKYLITISNADWSQHCDIEIDMTNSSFTRGASNRNAPKLNFEAYQAQRTVDLQWLTNSGYKVAQFELERSIDGENFETLTQLVNKVWTEKLEYHQTTDLVPVKGFNYYRVKEVYLDGSHAYTDVKQVGFFADLEKLAVYPNPAQQQLNFNLKPIVGKAAKVNIINTFGQVVQHIDLGIIAQQNVQIELNKAISNGFYQVHIEIEGQKTVTKKLMVKRLY